MQEDLPLGWTKVKRTQRSPRNDADGAFCCEDQACARRPSRQQEILLEKPSSEEITQGHAIFFFHKIDPEWFQGYFLVDGAKKPWGLLAVQKDIDDCLQCTEGGYRQIELTVVPYPRRKKVTCKDVEWTGGDMMRLSGQNVEFETERYLTGAKATPLIKQYFANLIKKLCVVEGCDMQQILGTASEFAVSTGFMKMSVPNHHLDEDF